MKISLHISNPHECGYFDDRLATTLFVDPNENITSNNYHALLQNGFRRSGKLVYKPHCGNCQACVPLRVNAKAFRPSRSQQRILKKNNDVTYAILPPEYRDDHYGLYKDYLSARHKDGGMEKHTQKDYRESMMSSGVDTVLIEYRIKNRLICVAITDLVEDGLSAVYTFFDPQLSKQRSLGTFAIASQLYLAKSLQRSWLYMGYWIEDSKKMSYKSNFSGAEILTRGEWNQF